jgi:hypothetical protein
MAHSGWLERVSRFEDPSPRGKERRPQCVCAAKCRMNPSEMGSNNAPYTLQQPVRGANLSGEAIVFG